MEPLSKSVSNKDISPRILSQYEAKIREVDQKINDIAQKLVIEISQKKSFSYNNFLAIHHMIHQLQDKAKVARQISKKEPQFKQYRELYTKTIKICYDQAAVKIIDAMKEREIDVDSEKVYNEAKEILKTIHNLK